MVRVFSRFAAGSAIAMGCSQLAFLLAFGVFGASAAASGAVAFIVGAVPNFVIHRFWTWQRQGRAGMRRELTRYLGVITLNGLLATAVTAGTDRVVGAGIDDHTLRTMVLAVTFAASYGLLFVLKFTLLDRLVFAPRVEDPAAAAGTERSRHQVPSNTRA
jgi:putative flippase GtrA